MAEKTLEQKTKAIVYNQLIKKMRKRLEEATDDIEDFYLEQVGNFYAEYTPINERPNSKHNSPWNRHPFSSIEESGMARTYMRVKGEFALNKTTYVMYSGIALNTNRMYRDYCASLRYNGHNDWVLWSFTQGYHGLPAPYDYAPRSSSRPIEKTREYINNTLKPKVGEVLKY